MQNADGET